jgi:tetratricopeptide (TPR) repeat protein
MTNKYITTFLLLLFLISCSNDKNSDKTNTQDLSEATKNRMRDSIGFAETKLGSHNDPKIALPYSEAKYKVDTLNIKYFLEYVEMLSVCGQTQKAFSLLNQTLKWSDKKAKIYESKGTVWQSVAGLQRQRGLDYKFALDSAIAYYEKACQTDSTDVQLFITLSQANEFFKNYAEAINNINHAIKIQPNNRTHYLFRGIYKFNLEDYKGAYEDLTPITDIRRMEYEWYYYRGLAASWINKIDEAIKDLDTCEMLNYKTSDLYYNRGKLKTNIKELKHEGYLEIKKAEQMGYPVPKDELELVNKRLAETHI